MLSRGLAGSVDDLVPPVVRRHLPGLTLPPVVLALALGAALAGERAPSRVDAYVDPHVTRALAWADPLLRTAVDLASPPFVIVVSLVLAGACAARRLLRPALLVLLGPTTALAVTAVLKAVVGRHPESGTGDAYPSGHATAAFALGTAVLLLTRWPSAPLPRPVAVAARVAAVVGPLGAGLALISLGFHTVTDVVGGTCVGLSTVLVLAAGIDRVRRDTSEPG